MEDRKKQWTEAQIEEQLKYAFWLSHVEGLGNRTRWDITEYAGSPREVFQIPKKELEALMSEKKVNKLIASKEKWDVTGAYEQFKGSKMRFLPGFHADYPSKLSEIEDAPYAVYVLGALPDVSRPSVAIIGARECSEYGKYMAEKCGAELAQAHINVISGMARGIDGIAQKAALQMGGSTYAVLGCGADVCYPAENRHIYERMKQQGGVLSEYHPGTQPNPRLFPPRNRIISGLADVVVIIEARKRSGTLITADMALEQGRDVYVVPGRVTDSLSEGCNRLVKQGAGIMTSIKEMLEETGLGEYEAEQKNEIQKNMHVEMHAEQILLKALDYYPKSVQCLQTETGLDYQRTIYLLLKLCMEEKAKQVSAGSYVANGCFLKKKEE